MVRETKLLLVFCRFQRLTHIEFNVVYVVQVSRESRVCAPVRLSGESSSTLPLHRQRILGQPRRGRRSQASHPHGGAQREDSPPAHQGQEITAQEGPVTDQTEREIKRSVHHADCPDDISLV